MLFKRFIKSVRSDFSNELTNVCAYVICFSSFEFSAFDTAYSTFLSFSAFLASAITLSFLTSFALSSSDSAFVF